MYAWSRSANVGHSSPMITGLSLNAYRWLSNHETCTAICAGYSDTRDGENRTCGRPFGSSIRWSTDSTAAHGTRAADHT